MVIIKLFQIILNIACGITAGALPIMGYNYGARLYSRVKETFKLVVLSTLTVCVIATVLFESVPLVFVRMFGTDGGELYTNFAIGCLRIYLSMVIFTCLQKACAMFLQSIGHAKAAVPLSVLRDILLIVLAIVMPMGMGIMGILWSAPAADVISIAVTVVVAARVWKTMGADAQPDGQTESVLQPTRPGVIVTIARSDAARGAYYKSISGREWGDARQYELSVDSSIGLEKTAELICDYISRMKS